MSFPESTLNVHLEDDCTFTIRVSGLQSDNPIANIELTREQVQQLYLGLEDASAYLPHLPSKRVW